MDVIVFDIWGDYAHFRKYYTTSSPLTFSFPPPSTLIGIIGTIFGASKNKDSNNYYLKLFSFETIKLGLKIVNVTDKIRMGLNLINTKGNYWTPVKKGKHEPRTQIKTEFLKNPKFRIYFSHSNQEIFKTVETRLSEHKCIYTVSLGLSELLANFKYLGTYSANEMFSENFIELSTPISSEIIIENSIEIENGKKYFKEKIPAIMNTERVIEKYSDIIYEPDGKTIKAKVKSFYKLENGENIAFF